MYLIRRRNPNGRSISITAAAGGVGSTLVQLARPMGAKRIIAAASSVEKRHFRLELGADVAIDYTDPEWVDCVSHETGGTGPDIIYESTGGNITSDCLRLLGAGGKSVISGALNIQDFSSACRICSVSFSTTSPSPVFALAPLLTPDAIKQDLAFRFDDLTASLAIRAHIGGIFPLSEASEASRLIENRNRIGRIRLKP